ncbi:unnamed protein product, partial [Rangifer tarandus platyrhynchus]
VNQLEELPKRAKTPPPLQKLSPRGKRQVQTPTVLGQGPHRGTAGSPARRMDGEKPGLGASGFNPEERVHTALSSHCKSGSDEPHGLQALSHRHSGDPSPYRSQLQPPHPQAPQWPREPPRQRDLHTPLALQRPLLATRSPRTRPRQERKAPQNQAPPPRELQSLT